MRVAPVGLCCARTPRHVRPARRAPRVRARLRRWPRSRTATRPARLAAGAFAAIVALLARDWEADEAIDEVLPLVVKRPLGSETRDAIGRAVALARQGTPAADRIASLGEGWIAEEALAIAVYATLAAPDYTSGVLLAVNHDGDSDSTGAIAGNLLGALHGVENVPRKWLSGLELGTEIAAIADDLATWPDWPIGEFIEETEASNYWRTRYPPC